MNRITLISAITKSLFEGRLLHLFPDEVVPTISTLPYQSYLVGEDCMVANKADRCHGPENRSQLLLF